MRTSTERELIHHTLCLCETLAGRTPPADYLASRTIIVRGWWCGACDDEAECTQCRAVAALASPLSYGRLADTVSRIPAVLQAIYG